MNLSDRATSVWAKTGGPLEWLPLAQHMLDSFHVAGALHDHWLSRAVKTRWATGPFSPEQLRVAATFLAMTHDVGKAAPAFVAQSEPLAQRARDTGLPCPLMDEIREDRKVLPHSLISQHALTEWLKGKGIAHPTAMNWASIAGAHHGRPVSKGNLLQARRRPHAVGGEPWQAVRTELLEWAADLSGFSELATNDLPALPLPMLVELSGFVIVADWLASNTRLFPLRDRSSDGQPESDPVGRAQFAWDEIAMPPAWEPPKVEADATSFFRQRFFPDAPTATPHPVQEAVYDIAHAVDVGLMFIETVTGGGKTEAALAAAEVLAARRGAQGVLVALPTQATSNAMFGRVAAWLARLPEAPREVGAWALTLGHGKSMLNADYARLAKKVAAFDRRMADIKEFSSIHEQADEEGLRLSNAVVHQWFLSAKRRLLANFSVVTIDQLLMAGLQRKHLMLAHVALSGKVVIIDEAHASDDFMNVYLDSVLSWLGAYDVPVIVLSATLTAERRVAMMRSYARHRAAEIDRLTFDPRAYPLLTVVPRDDSPILTQVVTDSSRARTVRWSWHSTDLEELVSTVTTTLNGKGCALVVRNTVKDAQTTATALAEAGLPVKLNHAGFIAADRAANDDDLRFLFGKEADGQRPELAVVVATQVVEQSLDVDFDVLFTDAAPMDLLIQRIGRLHRHLRHRPEHLTEAHCHVLADVAGDATPQATSGSVAVYGEHLLLRTVVTLVEHGDGIALPADVSPLVAKALGNTPIGHDSWQDALAAAASDHESKIRTQRAKAKTWCIQPWAGSSDKRKHLGDWLRTEDASEYDEIQMGATVRDTNPTVEVVIVPTTPDGSAAIRPQWQGLSPLSADILDVSTLPSDDLAREIATWSVRLPGRLTPSYLPTAVDDVIAAISEIPATKRSLWRRHPLLKGELLLPMRQTDEGSTTLTAHLRVRDTTHLLRYSPDRGLEVITDDLQFGH